ncbi:MAG: hypothetical protein Q7U68_00225 [Candidatus Roizmanbacteria bacterium]|nr:hypothetical protein [Candidatus Roizmanbacteria bacterium]
MDEFVDMSAEERRKIIDRMREKEMLSREEIVKFLKKYPPNSEIHKYRGEHNGEIVYDFGTTVGNEGVYHKKQPSNFVKVANVNGLGKREVWPIGIVAGKGQGPKK